MDVLLGDNITWLVNTSEIHPYESAVLGNNYLAFYTIHCVAICIIITSLISCFIVIISILRHASKSSWDFSDRFPLYLAIADALWGIPHLIDHLVLITTLKYPDPLIGTALSINFWFFLGLPLISYPILLVYSSLVVRISGRLAEDVSYQQLMHAGLATYTYLKIVRGISIDLGKGEWKLHAFILSLVALSVALFYPLGSFGCSGYWFLQDIQTKAGLALGIYIGTSVIIHALCTTVGYRSIKKIVETQRKAMLSHSKKGRQKTKEGYHSTATECLTTFVRIAVGLYCSLAVVYWVFVVESLFGFIEPFTPFVIVILADSSGWANALGYFHNNKIKAKRNSANDYIVSLPSNSSI